MALSQIQCLDENHVNPRTHESKPEFFYCEDQRLAVETLLRDGRDAFVKYLEARGLRGFLSDPELETLAGVVEPYDPGAELFQEDDEDDPTPLSQHYWPDLSDTSVPQMDLGWPDSGAYRGVTRTTVYTQPPLDGQTHIKEVVRKLIAQAQKMIAVAMDVFTDVDIFRDLLDAGFKRRVSVYILLERATLPHFLSMCQRANMHAGHFKHLRVRCTGGNEFCTRSCHKVKGRMGHRFMFIDGDKAVSGSYSFTWMSSRLDRNLITVVTGQATDSFDRLFRFLFGTSGSVDLRQVAMDPEPEPEPLLQPATVAPPSADIARKLYSPKYALVALSKPNPTTSVGLVSPKETQSSENSKKRRRRAGEEATKDAPPLHPGLMNLEKAYLIPYLPIWPEPDPSSDVIGFINIRDANKPNQVHLQRSEMFGTSQAIRFSSPFSEAKKTLPEVTNPKQTTAKHEEAKKLQPAQNKTEAEKLVVADKARLGVASSDTKSEQEAPEQKLTVCENKSEPDKDAFKAVNTENKLYSKTATNQGARHIADVLRAQTLPQSISQEPQGGASHTTHTVCTSHPNTRQEADTGTGLNAQSAAVDRTHSRESNGAQNSPPPGPADSNTEQDTPAETVPSHPAAVLLKPETQTPVVHRHVSSTSVSFTTLSPRLPSSSSSSSSSASPSPTSAPPVPKPRTVQLVIQDGSTGNGLKLPELCEFKRPQAVKQTPPGKEPETDPEQQDESGSKTEARKGKETTGNPEEAPQQTQKTEVNEADGRHDGRAGARVVAGTEPPTRSDVLITDVPKAAGVNTRGIIPKDVDPKSSTSTDCRTATGCGASVHTDEKATGCELTKVPSENVTRCKTHLVRAQESQRISYCQLTPQDVDVFQAADASEPPIHRPVSTCRDGAGDGKTSRGETPTLSGSAGDSSSTRRCKEETTEAEGTAHQDDGREEEQNGRKVSVAEREARRTDRRDGEETKRSVDSFRQREDSRETAEKGSDARRRKEVLHQSAAGGPLGGGVTAGQSANEGPETKRWCTGDLKPKSLSSERERSDKVSSLPHTLPKSQRIQQLDSLDLSPPRVPRPPRPLSANQTSSDRPSGSRQPNQTALPGSPQVLDNNPHRPPPSPSFPGPAGSAPGRKQVSDSQQSLVPRQPPAAPSRTRDGPTQNQTASHKPQSPFLFTQLHPQPRSQVLSAQEAHEQEDGKSPFSFSFSRLYSLKGLKDKMSKLPAQSKRGGSSPPVQGQGKSTS